MKGLQAALEQENASRRALAGEAAAAEAAARAAHVERDARARDLLTARAALRDHSEKLAAASAERDMHQARVSALPPSTRRIFVVPTYSAPHSAIERRRALRNYKGNFAEFGNVFLRDILRHPPVVLCCDSWDPELKIFVDAPSFICCNLKVNKFYGLFYNNSHGRFLDR